MPGPIMQFRSQSELIDYLQELEDRLSELENQNKMQKLQIQELERGKIPGSSAAIATPGLNPGLLARLAELPKTGLLSNSFIQRAFTVWGHYFVAQFIISAVVGVIYIILMVIFIAIGAGSGLGQ